MPEKIVKSNATFNFAILYFLHYITSSLIMSQRMTFLIRSSYTLRERSIIFAAIPLVSIGLQFIVGYLSDKYQSVKKIYLSLLILSTITAYLFYSVETQFFIFHFVSTIFSTSLINALAELNHVWVLESQGLAKNNYSFIRSFGFAGWAVGSYLLAQIIFYFNYQVLALSSMIFNILVFLIALTISDDKAVGHLKKTQAIINLSDLKEIFKNKTYLLMILIMFFIRFGDELVGYILIDKILALGGSEWHIGMRYVIAAAVEIPIFVLGDKIHQKIGGIKMIFIGIIAYTLKFFGYYLAKTNNIIFLVTSLQAFSLPLFIVASRYLILEISPPKLTASSQMIGPAIVYGLQGVLHPLSAALLVALFSLNSPLLLATIFGIIALILTFFLAQLYQDFLLDNKK